MDNTIEMAAENAVDDPINDSFIPNNFINGTPAAIKQPHASSLPVHIGQWRT